MDYVFYVEELGMSGGQLLGSVLEKFVLHLVVVVVVGEVELGLGLGEGCG